MKFNFKKIIANIYVRNILLMIAVLAIIITAVLFWINSYTRHDQSITVPALKGLQVEEAAAIVKSYNLNYEVVDSVYEKKGVPGSIIEQVPRENTHVKDGRTIYLIVQAKSQQFVSIPDLTDYSQRQAEALLNSLGFSNIRIEEVASDYKGLVLSVEYKGVSIAPGQKIERGSVLLLKVGSGGVSSETDSLSTTIEEAFN